MKPVAVKPPFAARIQEAVGGEYLEDFGPVGALAAGAEEGLPEGVELELAPELGGQPTSPPLTGPVKFHGVEAHVNAMASSMGGEGCGGGEKGQLALGAGVLVEDADGAEPCLALGVVDFAKIEDLPLDDAAGGALVFGNAVVAVGFAVLVPPLCFEEHSAVKNTPISGKVTRGVCTKGWKPEIGGQDWGNRDFLTLK